MSQMSMAKKTMAIDTFKSRKKQGQNILWIRMRSSRKRNQKVPNCIYNYALLDKSQNLLFTCRNLYTRIDLYT